MDSCITLQRTSTGVDIFFSEIFSYFCFFVAAWQTEAEEHHDWQACYSVSRFIPTQGLASAAIGSTASHFHGSSLKTLWSSDYTSLCNETEESATYLKSLPWQAGSVEVHQDVAERLHVVTATGGEAQMMIVEEQSRTDLRPDFGQDLFKEGVLVWELTSVQCPDVRWWMRSEQCPSGSCLLCRGCVVGSCCLCTSLPNQSR